MSAPPLNLHATVVVAAGRGILIRGAPGSGKSSLALSLLRRAEGVGVPAALIGDDQIFVTVQGGVATARVAEAIAGLIEVRGVGLLRQAFEPSTRLDLVVDLLDRGEIERLPEPATVEIAGVALPRIALPARDPAFGADVLLSVLAASEIVPSDPLRR